MRSHVRLEHDGQRCVLESDRARSGQGRRSIRRSPSSDFVRASVSSAIRRYVVSLPPATLSIPPGLRLNTVSLLVLTLSRSPAGRTHGLRTSRALDLLRRLRTQGNRRSVRSARHPPARRRRRGVPVVFRIRREEEHVVPGHGEGHANVVLGDRQRRSPFVVQRREDVSALAQPNRVPRRASSSRLVIHPRSGGVDDDASVDGDVPAVQRTSAPAIRPCEERRR
jgi:hypothetical protein